MAVFLTWETAHRGVFAYQQGIYPIDPVDEWRYTACSRLVAHGYQLFNQVFSAQPPLLFLSLAGGMRVAGDSIAGARWTEIGFGLLGLLAATWLSWSLAGKLGAAVTAGLLAISPGFLVYAHTVEAEGPMVALTTLSLAFAAAAYKQRRLEPRERHRPGPRLLPRAGWWAAAAGLAMAAAILMKLFAVEAVVPAGWLLVVASDSIASRMRAVATFLVCTALPVIADGVLVSPLHQWQQVVSLHNRAASLALPDLTPPGRIISWYLGMDWGLAVLAGAGLFALAVLGRWRLLTTLVLWLPGTILMLLLFRPLFPHHAAILSAPLAVTAGIGAAAAYGALSAGRWPAVIPVAGAVLAYGIALPNLIHNDRHVVYVADRSTVYRLAAYVGSRVPAGRFAAVDNLEIADAAHRLVPPPLCDPSTVRRLAGYLTPADFIGATERYAPALVLSTDGIYVQEPGYLDWLRRHYKETPAPSGLAFVPR